MFDKFEINLKDGYEVSTKALKVKVCTRKRSLENGWRANEKIYKIHVPRDYRNTEVEPLTLRKARKRFSEKATLDLSEKKK